MKIVLEELLSPVLVEGGLKKKKKKETRPCQLATHYSCLASSNDPLAALLSLCGTEEILPSSPCARYHAGECDSHSPVSDEYSGCKIKGETHSYTCTDQLGISSLTISLSFVFVPGRVQAPRLNPFITPTGCYSSALSLLDTPSPAQQHGAKYPSCSRTTEPLSYLPSSSFLPPHHSTHLAFLQPALPTPQRINEAPTDLRTAAETRQAQPKRCGEHPAGPGHAE